MPDLDELGRFDLSDDERERLRAIWRSPGDAELFGRLRLKVMGHLGRILRECGKESIDYVRGQMDVMDWWFDKMDASCLTDKELPSARIRVPEGI